MMLVSYLLMTYDLGGRCVPPTSNWLEPDYFRSLFSTGVRARGVYFL